MKRLWLPIAFLVLAALAMVAIMVIFNVNRQAFTSSDNAELVAPTYAVVAPAAGRMTAWTSHMPGSPLVAGERLGTLATQQGEVVLRVPHAGRLVGDYAYWGASVAQGQEVALIADLRRAYVLAYVTETSAGKIKPGQAADLRFADEPGTLVVGTVWHVYPAVASVVWPVPSLTLSRAFSQQAQWVPVSISLPRSYSLRRYLGMSASVRIAIGGGGS